jgi:hypothetical protein
VSRAALPGSRLGLLRDAELDATAVAAGEQLHVENAFTDLSPFTYQGRPSAAHAADPKVLYSE